MQSLTTLLTGAFNLQIRDAEKPSPGIPGEPASVSPQLHWLLRAAIVAITVALATALMFWLRNSFNVQAQYLTYFPAVLAIGLSLGATEGVCATALCGLSVDYFFTEGYGFTIAHTGDRIGILLFLCSGVALSFVAGALRTRTRQAELAIEELRSSKERRLAEQTQFHEAGLRLAAIVESTADAVIGTDIQGAITDWNNGAEVVFGYTAAEIIGQSIKRLIPPDREREEDEILSHILLNQKVEHFETVRITKNGRNVHLSVTISPIKDSSGEVIGASKIARDITETRNLRRQLLQSQKMEAIGQLTGGIAHDFNNLLAITLGALELQQPLVAGNPEAEHRRQVALKAALRGAELTRRLLAFSSMRQFKSVPVNLCHSVRNTMELATRLVGPEIKTILKMDEYIPMVLVDPAGLESALLNLVINARDAMPRGGGLTIHTRTVELEESFTSTLSGNVKPGAYACISVTDTGTGMSVEVAERAFEPFFTTKARGRGTGLGLSTVYGFVKQSGGGIRIDSEPGFGATINLYLPLAADIQQKPAPDSGPKSVAKKRGVVLIVDDEPDLVEIAVCYLKAVGYTVLSAKNGKEALAIIENHSGIDAMVTDIVMGGGMDGMELAQSVRRLSPGTRVVYSSGFPTDALSERSLPLADALILQKPYSLANLGACVDAAICAA
jgi:PAS domain S-box-containing protein